MEAQAQLVAVTEVAKLLTQDQVEQAVLAVVEDTDQEVVAGQSPHPMVEQQLLVKDMRVELGANQTIMVAVAVAVVHLLAEMLVLQLEATAALVQHQA
jgi:hypothetical protein